jgi:hypothetical protein
LSPAASPEKALTLSPELSDEPLDTRRYTNLPETLHAELEEYDARASRAETIHYFSDNQHAQYVCRECMIPLVSTLPSRVPEADRLNRLYRMKSSPRRFRGVSVKHSTSIGTNVASLTSVTVSCTRR